MQERCILLLFFRYYRLKKNNCEKSSKNSLNLQCELKFFCIDSTFLNLNYILYDQ